MKVITEERLREIINDIDKTVDNKFPNGGYIADMTRSSTKACLESLLSDGFMEEIDTLTVSKLRSMSEAIGHCGNIQVYFEYLEEPGFEYYTFDVIRCTYLHKDGSELVLDGCTKGWIPGVEYKPEQP